MVQINPLRITRSFSSIPRSLKILAQLPLSDQQILIMSIVIGIIISATIIVVVYVCASYASRREKRTPEAERGTVYWTMKPGAALIEGYICVITIIVSVAYFLVPHFFTPNLAVPVIAAVLIGVIIIVIISYRIGRRLREQAQEPHEGFPIEREAPTTCSTCGKALDRDEKFCGNCGAAIG
jgi:heme/copper-type cytochrome/quinol oxidase subunit 2